MFFISKFFSRKNIKLSASINSRSEKVSSDFLDLRKTIFHFCDIEPEEGTQVILSFPDYELSTTEYLGFCSLQICFLSISSDKIISACPIFETKLFQ